MCSYVRLFLSVFACSSAGLFAYVLIRLLFRLFVCVVLFMCSFGCCFWIDLLACPFGRSLVSLFLCLIVCSLGWLFMSLRLFGYVRLLSSLFALLLACLLTHVLICSCLA